MSVFEIDEERDMLAYGTADGGMYVVSFSDQTELLRFGDDRVPVLSLHYNAADNMIGFGTAKGRIMLADTRDWSIFREFRAANGPVWSMLVMPKGDTLVIGGLDDHITEWSIFEFPPEFLSRRKTASISSDCSHDQWRKQFARKCSVCHTLEKMASVAPAQHCLVFSAERLEPLMATPIPRHFWHRGSSGMRPQSAACLMRVPI